ncbi:hypothetical protein BBO99_00000687 [Phytophthora kernoviae]|uniref:Protein kinase domain-containing protein n=2 Tax=Phytophthora kernoviae TaxID=325452 RepID=A0A3R7K179_9STRA|nr:hypothetical protein G195_004384 [Phytophthora kernoviae 00238/432]KAG2529717.1 hypothetical protein JM18_002711 [Phytophthora kernoviae]RLN44848.1 hypothetical protein BBI17_002826 [Phytophthora kernoviae]RLN85205.1 hypothetical protein BBO99_00000687 [Phytophthora kernoviae]
MALHLYGVLRLLRLVAVGTTVAVALTENGSGAAAQDSGRPGGDSGFGARTSLRTGTSSSLSTSDSGDSNNSYDEIAAYIARGTIRHCNISSLDQSFLENFTRLQTLNLEANRISSIYTTLPGSDDALNAMTEIDLSGNDIVNLTLTSDEFVAISLLSFFNIDIPGNAESNCDTGVYKHRRVAVKKIMREKCEKLAQIRMFVREITLMGSLKHERIVEFIGVAWDSLRNLSAVTEYMERGDLRDVLRALKNQGNSVDHSFTWQGRKLTIALHIAEGLAYMHSLNPKLIHRDLKSKNVLLNSEYAAKLSDFGVSRERLVAEDDVEPGPFMTPGVGTSFWIAPEVLLGKDYDERADIFSFGVVLSEIDTDDYPYWNSGSAQAQDNLNERRSHEQKILEKVALGSLRPTFYNDCPSGVLALAASCLEGRPENRPSASEVVLTISELIREIQLNSREFPEPEPDEIATDGFLSNTSSR